MESSHALKHKFTRSFASISDIQIAFLQKAAISLHTSQDRVGAKMRSNLDSGRVSLGNAFYFIALVLKPISKFAILAMFRSSRSANLSEVFCSLYSKMWDYAEHSISHQGFGLPSALGTGPAHRVNEHLCALYGAQYSSLSFGGSSGALLTILTAVLPKLHPSRELILFDDVCHQSAIGGLIFGRWKAVRLVRSKHPHHQTVFPLSFEVVKTAIERHGPEKFAAIILVLPSYDGYQSSIEGERIYAYAQSHGIKVIADGAWDALRFRNVKTKSLPLSSICDIWISSPHKRGLTPSSLGCILTNDEAIARYWDEALELGFRSSSISFVELMIAEYRLAQIVAGRWDDSFNKAEHAARQLRNRVPEVHPDLYVVTPGEVEATYCDPAHILISTDRISNFDARNWADMLSNQFGLDVEKATASTLLLLCASPSHLENIEQIIFSLRQALIKTLSRHYD